MNQAAIKEYKNSSISELNSIILGDCIDVMKELPDNTFDLAIADPPYNVSKGGHWNWDSNAKLPGFGGSWEKVMEKWDNMPLAHYFDFSLAWLSELKRLVKPTGSIWVHGTYHNIGIINFVMQLLEIEIINEVIWYKRNSFPNLSTRRLTASHETILWAHTGDAKQRKYFFNYEKSKDLVFEGDLLKKPGKQMRTVWDIPNNKKYKEISFGKHPMQKPVRIVNRILTVSSQPGDSVLVPFSGSGTECVAAKAFGLDYIGIDNDESYVKLALKRLAAIRTESIF